MRAPPTDHTPPTEQARAQLHAINLRNIHALAVPDPDFIETLVDEDFLFTSCEGAWIDRVGYLELRRNGPGESGARCDGVCVRMYGPVALVQGTLQASMDEGLQSLSRYSDVYVWRHDAWRLVSSQHTTVQTGKAVAPHGRWALLQPHWAGEDPVGDPLTVLHLLNEQYVQAYREADVAWYDAHLAPDYNAVQDNGTLNDRASALVRFAQPSFALQMRAFPVDRVTIRRFGDVALIHAENAYTLKDGRQGVSRYTDIWRMQSARWTCVSAHITEHQPPV